jgi:uncharacterized protein (DUF58 family)
MATRGKWHVPEGNTRRGIPARRGQTHLADFLAALATCHSTSENSLGREQMVKVQGDDDDGGWFGSPQD